MNAAHIEIADYLLVVLGVLLWIIALVRGRAIEWFVGPDQLPVWRIASSEFLAFVAAFLLASYAAPLFAAKLFSLDLTATPMPPTSAMTLGYAVQLSWLALCALFCTPRFLRPHAGSMRPATAAVAGLTGFLLFLPAGAAAGRLWQLILPYLHFSDTLQDSVNYLRHVGSAGEFIGWLVLFVGLAPVVEEWAFRGLLYRFLSARMPSGAAITVSAVLFGLMHDNPASFLPLLVLGIALCLAYRYTGRLITPIVMHAVFNLHTLVVVVLSRNA